MPRASRTYAKSGIYHVIIRGNNRQNIFLDDSDRFLIINRIKKYSQELNIPIYAYCLMSNHVHLLIGKATPSISKFMLKLNTSYSRLFNIKYERCGHLFQGRFLSQPIENDSSFKIVLRYILQNPEKAGLESYNKYQWNSFSQTMKKTSNIIDLKTVLSFFGSKKHFRDFVKTDSKDVCLEYENKKYISDQHCVQLIRTLLNINHPHSLQSLDKETLLRDLRVLKKVGMTQNQISRITGLSRALIRSA